MWLTLVQDDSGHDFVIPMAKLDAWYDWLGSDEMLDGELPEYAEYVCGIIEFKEWRQQKGK